MQCPSCSTTASAGARFCRRCGSPLPAVTGGRSGPAPAAAAGADDALSTDDEDTTVLRTPEGIGTAVRCVSCGAPNSALRELCGRCGSDLETGVAPPSAEDAPAPAPEHRTPNGHSQPPRVRFRGWWLVPGAAVLVAAIVLALTLAGFGPLAGGPDLPDAEFSSDVYGEEASPLLLSDIATSSTLEPGADERYDASQMADDDPATAWKSDGAERADGVGETIDLFLDEPAWVQRLVFNNGLQRDAEAYADNARIRRADVVLDGGERLSIRLEDLGLQRQAVELPEPLLTTTVRLEVTEAFAGDAEPDLAVSDVGLEGWSARGADVEVARERAERARASRGRTLRRGP